jgi:hypothetical protein
MKARYQCLLIILVFLARLSRAVIEVHLISKDTIINGIATIGLVAAA